MVDTRDILIKAAEDVTQGMWCKGSWFRGVEGEWDESGDEWVAFATETTDKLAATERCAEGSILLAARLLGGDYDDYESAVTAVEANLPDHDPLCISGQSLHHYNDIHASNDPFEAGQELAELFRTTAEAL